MPRIFDNIELKLLPLLQETLKDAKRADFCVGYLNLRGWQQLDRFMRQFSGRDAGCGRLIVGMQKPPHEELQSALFLTEAEWEMDQRAAHPLRQSAVDPLNWQLKSGIDDRQLAGLVVALRTDARLCIVHDEDQKREPQMICSLGLFQE